MNSTSRFHRFTAGLVSLIMTLTVALTATPLTAVAGSNEITVPLNMSVPSETSGTGWSYSSDDRMLRIEEGYTLRGFTKNGVATEDVCTASVSNQGVIAGGSFDTLVNNYSTITGGAFNGTVMNVGTITGGTFYKDVTNNGTITGGYFFLTPQGSSDSFGKDAKLLKTLSVESRGGSAALAISNNNEASDFLRINGCGIVGETYNVQNNTGELIGLYLLGDGDETPKAPYSIDTSRFRRLLGGFAYDFDMPDESTTVYAVYKGYGRGLTIGGALEEPFNFDKGSSWKQYLFGLQNPPTGLQTYEWSVEGTLPRGLSLMDSTKINAYIGGTPTEVTADPVALTVCVRATAANGDIYYGETDILINVNELINPFEEAETLLEATDCTVSMEAANTEETVLTWLNEIWLPGIDGLSATLGGKFDISELSVVLDEGYTSATAGNAADPDGTDGSVSFTVEIGGEIVLCENLICTVKATAYNHTHSFSDAYTYDDKYHWHKCTDPECDAVSEKAEHSGEDDNNCKTEVVCKCGYVITSAATHDYSGKYEYDADSHWHVCENDGCTATDTAEKHSGGSATYTTRAVCSVCNQSYGATSADTTSPTGIIKVGNKTWDSLLDTITFESFFKSTQSVFVTAADTESGVMKTEYILSDKKLADFESAAWTEYNGNLKISQDNEYVIYVKITDNAGNFVIISSNGIVLDSTAPIITTLINSGMADNNTYCGPKEIIVVDKYLVFVSLNRNGVFLSDGKFTVNPADGQQTITAIDKAGNSTTYMLTVNNGHTWPEKFEPINGMYHGHICTVCGEHSNVSLHNYVESTVSSVCSICGYKLVEGSPVEVNVYNNSVRSNATIWLTGTGLSSDDILFTKRNPQGSSYEALIKLADSSDVVATYNIYLRSGNKSTGKAMNLTFNLNDKYGGQDFTLVHEKADGTYEYFYDDSDADGDLTFGPLYELSPFMLVKGTLLPPDGSDSGSQLDSNSGSPQTGDKSNVFLWIALLVVSGGAVTMFGIAGKRRRAANDK